MIFPKHLLFLILFCVGSTLQALPSLFFSKEEIARVQKAPNQKMKESEHSLTLSSLTYVDDTHWSLWLNNQIVSPDSPPLQNDLSISLVTPENVTFTWDCIKCPSPILFTLSPGETYLFEGETFK